MDLLKPIKNSAVVRRMLDSFTRRVVSRGTAGNSRNERLAHVWKCFEFIGVNGIQGDVLQFGVSAGGSLVMMDRFGRQMREMRNVDYRIFGFDSFEGLPELEGKDKNVHFESKEGMNFHKGRYAATKAAVLARLEKIGADTQRIHLVEGWYDKVLTPELRDSLGIERATLIDIDCDLYESTIVALNWCEPVIKQGTIISFDDWFIYEGRRDHGEQLAFQEFLDAHPDITAVPFSGYSWHGRSFLIHRD